MKYGRKSFSCGISNLGEGSKSWKFHSTVCSCEMPTLRSRPKLYKEAFGQVHNVPELNSGFQHVTGYYSNPSVLERVEISDGWIKGSVPTLSELLGFTKMSSKFHKYSPLCEMLHLLHQSGQKHHEINLSYGTLANLLQLPCGPRKFRHA